mmetsp:Transcript_10086/g.24210  ORF Transcript_10086/g.24210 Transcript_10086/m.24210 type:complete len:233 (+) Transcript_10086:180-878(+)
MVVPHGILRVVHGELAVVHLVVRHRIRQNPIGYYVKGHVVRRVVEHGQCGVDVEKDKNDDRVGPAHSNGRQNGAPGADDPDDVLDRVLVAGVEVSPGGKVLPVVVLVDERIERRHVQYVVTGGVADVQHQEHDPEGTNGVDQSQVLYPEGDLRRVPDVVAESLDKDPLVDRVDGEKDAGFRVETNVANGGSGGPGRQVLLGKEGIDRVDHEVVVEIDRQADDEASEDPVGKA